MNKSLFFTNLTNEEILRILSVVSVPCLMEPLNKQPERYFGKLHKGKSLSREAVNHIYLKNLKENDLVLSLYLSDLVVDIIHYFKLSDGFKKLLTTSDSHYVHELKQKVEKRGCPITVDMFMRLLDATSHQAYDIEKENQTYKKEETYEVEVEKTAEENETYEIEVEENQPIQEPVVVEEEPVVVEDDPKVEFVEEKNDEELALMNEQITKLEEEISNLQYQLMNLQMENESLKDENRDLLFQGDDDGEKEELRHGLSVLEIDNQNLRDDVKNLASRNVQLEQELQAVQKAADNENQMRLELRDYKIKFISLQSEYDNLQYMLKNDNKKLKELENKQRSVHESKEDLMMALHDLTWYKKQWHLPGDAPIHKIWAHLNNEEAKKLSSLMKNYGHLVKSEKREQVESLKEILIVKEAILILLKANRTSKKNETQEPF